MSKSVNTMTNSDLLKFYVLFGKAMGIKFVWDPGFLQRLVKRLWGLACNKFKPACGAASFFELRPMTFGRIVFLPYWPTDANATARRQVEIAVHEATHSNRIERYKGTTMNWYGRYFTEQQFRAIEEYTALLTQNELQYWLDGEMKEYSPAKIQYSYFITDANVEPAKSNYEILRRRVEKSRPGYATTKAATEAIRILKELGYNK